MAKLTSKQWDKLKLRLDNGEKASSLARDYGVTRQAISNRFAGQSKAVKEVANQIVESELSLQKSLQKLTPSLQLEAWDMAAELLHTSKHLLSGAGHNAMTFHRLAGIANIHAQKLDEDNPDPETLATISALVRVGNDSAKVGVDLIKANQAAIEEGNNKGKREPMTLDEFYSGSVN